MPRFEVCDLRNGVWVTRETRDYTSRKIAAKAAHAGGESRGTVRIRVAK